MRVSADFFVARDKRRAEPPCGCDDHAVGRILVERTGEVGGFRGDIGIDGHEAHAINLRDSGEPRVDTVPDGFRVVTKEEFFAALKADPCDIMLGIQHSPYYTTWETRSREVWGRSTPGWKNPRGEWIFALKQ